MDKCDKCGKEVPFGGILVRVYLKIHSYQFCGGFVMHKEDWCSSCVGAAHG